MARPRKNVPIYYTQPVLLDKKTYEKIRWAKLPGEPLGSVVQRLIAKGEHQVREEEQPLPSIILHTNTST